MDLNDLKRLLEEQGSAWTEYRRTNDEMLKAKADGKSVSDFEAKLAALDTKLAAIDAAKEEHAAAMADFEKKLNRVQPGMTPQGADLRDETKSFNDYRRAMSRPGHTVQDIDVDAYSAYREGFHKAMRHGEKSLTNDEVKAMQAGVDPDGGYLLPPPMMGRIVKKIWELTPLRQIVNVVSISGNDLEGIEDLDEAANGGWVSETAARAVTNTPQVGKWRIEAHEMYASPKVTQRILDDAAVDIEGWLADKVANKYARVEADAIVNGNGVGKPRGLLTYTTNQTADATRAWGTMEAIKSGASGAWHTTKADPLFDLIAAMKTAYTVNAQFVMNRATVASIRKLKEATSDQYLWQPGLQMGQPDRLLGYPIVICQDFPTYTTASALAIAFGNFSECYTLVDRIGIRTLRDPYTDKPYVIFYSTRRVGGGVVNSEAVKFITFIN
jgi:HK97 family phage major capsid protein